MKIIIEGSSQEIKEMLQAIASSEEQPLKGFVSTRIDGKEIANVPIYRTSEKLEVTSRSALESAGRIGKNEQL